MPYIVFTLIFLLAACDPNRAEQSTMADKTVILKLNEPVNELAKRLNIEKHGKVDRQPAGVDFYRLNFPLSNPGLIKIEHGQYSFEIPYTLGAVAADTKHVLEKRISNYRIFAGISQPDLISHQEARTRFMQMIFKLHNLGWQRYIIYSHPRLLGQDAFRYLLEHKSIYAPSVDYLPTQEEWMQLDSPKWVFIADGMVLTVEFQRDSDHMDPDQPGAYLLSFALMPQAEFAKDYVDDEERDNWKNLWVKTIKQLKTKRYKIEAELAAQGYTIDTDYKDPIIHPYDPVEPD